MPRPKIGDRGAGDGDGGNIAAREIGAVTDLQAIADGRWR
jgi:hypothetical protein